MTDVLSGVATYAPAVQTTTSAFVGVGTSPYFVKTYTKEANVFINNTGGSNSATYQILGSIDGGVTFPITETASAALAANTGIQIYITKYYTNLQIQIKDTVGGSHTTVQVTAVSFGK